MTVLLDQIGYPTTESELDGRLDYWLEDPASWLIGAEDGGALIGVAALHVLPILEKTGKFGRLLALVVEEQYLGRGVGRMPVTAIEDQARGRLPRYGAQQQPSPDRDPYLLSTTRI
ncbi:GNAT family N-acetyltransferase [Actinoplanes sp. TFC3]|uniref:GNAT family N-acetyltransferase n=1 Tax=Actinoplanes sp. TFC3 TaxID=1710355 RepID=UPI00191C0830|nr:GNAT family N-acetyltransferase [Actinoplanes sp. TFC3]